jgi:transposase
VISPLALEAVRRIDALFEIERSINGHSAERRRAVRQKLSAPLVADLESWLREQRAKLSRGNDLARAMDYLLKRWPAFTRFLDDGRICLSNNAAERALRGIALGRKSWLFAGSDEGASYCSSHHVLINAGYFVGDHRATGVVTGARLLHYERMRMPGQLAG